jgi:hypothetical protein
MNPTDFYPSETSHRDMAAGVLKQAEKDLRRFHRGTIGVARELYLDAYRWVRSDDCGWPFSFLNVCEILGVTPANLRQKLIGDQSLGMVRYQMRRCGRIIDRLESSLTRSLPTSVTQVPRVPVNSPDASFETDYRTSTKQDFKYACSASRGKKHGLSQNRVPRASISLLKERN